MRKIVLACIWIVLAAVLSGCAGIGERKKPDVFDLIEVTSSERQWTGVAVSQEGRIFVNFPRWSYAVPVSVVEITETGALRPYPDESWNSWDPMHPPEEHFVCVQSVYVDRDNYLWILDAANPRFEGVVKNAPKLVKVDLETDSIVQVVRFPSPIAPFGSYLNDVRVDTERGVAYIADSGLGAIIVADLKTGRSRRVLAGHHSTKSEGIVLVVEGQEWRRPDGTVPQVHADGIALDREGRYLYYQALSGGSLYRIETRWLRDEGLSEEELGEKVEFLATSGPADGLLFGPDGSVYITAIEENAIKRYTPDGRVETVFQDARLSWPDSFSLGPDDSIYVTTSRIHLRAKPAGPYRIFRLMRRKS